MAVQRIYKGMPVEFEHDEFGWVRGVAVRASPNGEEWLVKIKGDERWVVPTELYEVGAPRPRRNDSGY
jgi:hypothetical protein